MALFRRFINIFRRYPVSLLTFCVILYLSLYKPAGKSALMMFANMDKVAHFMMYATLSTVLWCEYYGSHYRVKYWRMFLSSFMLPILFSWLMEYLQDKLTTYRTNDPYDLLFNVIGVVFANILCFTLVKRIYGKRSKKKETRERA